MSCQCTEMSSIEWTGLSAEPKLKALVRSCTFACSLDRDFNDLSLEKRSMESMILIYIPKEFFFEFTIFFSTQTHFFFFHNTQDKKKYRKEFEPMCVQYM